MNIKTEQLYNEVADILIKKFRQLHIVSKLDKGVHVACRVEVHCNAIMIDPTVEEIKELLKDYNFKITGDTNSETITIQKL